MQMNPMMPVATPTYFAVEVKTSYEKTIDLAKVVLTVAKAQGILFRRLEAMDVIEIGSTKFMRFRTDLQPATQLVDAILNEGRGVIAANAAGGYELRSRTKNGPVPSTRILSTPRAAGTKMFRGTKIKLWERQFDADA